MLIQKYISKIMRDKVIRKRLRYVIFVLSLLVICSVSWQLRLNAITMSETLVCGCEEHVHSEACTEKTDQNCSFSGQEGHIHSEKDGCYEIVYTCGMKEHQHVQSCYAAQTEPVSRTETAAQTEPAGQPVSTEAETESRQTETAGQPGSTEAATAGQPGSTEAATAGQPGSTEAATAGQPGSTEAETEGRQTETAGQPGSTEAETEGRQTETAGQPGSTEAETEGRQTETAGQPDSTEAATENLADQTELPAMIGNAAIQRVPSSYQIHYFDFDFGNPDRGLLKTETVNADEKTTAPPIEAVPFGYEWDGKWYTDQVCTIEFDFSLTVGAYAQQAGLSGSDIMLYPGMYRVYQVVFVTNRADEGIPALSVREGTVVNLADYTPQRKSYIFDGWYTDEDLTQPVSGEQTITEDTTYYAKWLPGLTSFQAVRRLEEIEENTFKVEKKINTWYAKVGAAIYVESTYDKNDFTKNKHAVMWKLGEEQGPVTSDAEGTQPVYLNDVYKDYYLYNNENEIWNEIYGTEVVDGSPVSTGQVPYSDQTVIRDQGITKIYFDYMRARANLVFRMTNDEINDRDHREGGYYDFYQLQQDGQLSGTLYNLPDKPGNNFASGRTPSGLRWVYIPDVNYNEYIIQNIKVGSKNVDAYTNALGVTLTDGVYAAEYPIGNWVPLDGKLEQRVFIDEFPQEMTTGKGRAIKGIQWRLSRMGEARKLAGYLLQTLPGETPDCTIDGRDYTFDSSWISYQSAVITPREIPGCGAGFLTGTGYKGIVSNLLPYGYKVSNGMLAVVNEIIGGGAAPASNQPYTLIPLEKAQELAEVAAEEQQVSLSEVSYVYLYCYPRNAYTLQMQPNRPTADGSADTETKVSYSNLLYGTPLKDYQNGGSEIGDLLTCPGYEFLGWTTDDEMDQEAVMSDTDWDKFTMPEHDTSVYGKWKKLDYLIEFYADLPEQWMADKQAQDYLVTSRWMEDGEILDGLGAVDWSQYSFIEGWTSGGPLKWLYRDARSTGRGYQEFSFDAEHYRIEGIEEEQEVNGAIQNVHVIKVYAQWHTSEQEKTSLKVIKNWSDGAAAHKKDRITVHLYMDGKPVDTTQYPDVSAELELDDSSREGEVWTAVFDDLPYFRITKDGDYVPIQYTVTEDEVDGYYAQYGEVVTIPAAAGSHATYQAEITNTAGYRLPETGGIGTASVRFFGLLLMSISVMIRWFPKENLKREKREGKKG